jgi:non-specific serine/threonine protein kinase
MVSGRQVGDESIVASSLIVLGELPRMRGDYGAARARYEEALVLYKRVGNTSSVIANLCNLGAVAYYEDNYKGARSYYAEALSMAQVLGHKAHTVLILDGFAALAMKYSNPQLAARLSGAADHLRESIGYQLEAADLLFHDSYVADLRADLGEVAFAAASELGRAMKLDQAIVLALE